MAGNQDGSSKSLEVVCRIAPKNGKESCVSLVDDRYVKLIAPMNYVTRNNDAFVEKLFKFDCVFDENDTQRDIFRRCSLDFVENLISGNDSLLFTYGVTGSGKTFTMTGNAENDNSGLLPRTLDTKSLSNSRCCAVFISYIEIYNDMCYDLLDENLTDERLFTSKNIRIDSVTRKAYVEKIKEVEVESCDEAIEQFLQAQERRKIAKTLLNKSSSRSHSIFIIRLVSASLHKDKYYPDSTKNDIHVAEMSLVDLAGSERAKRTLNTDERLAESNKINQSLLTLRQCMERLRDNQRTQQHLPVPYRDTKLTYLFKTYFEGFGRIRMIVCVNPQSTDFEENLHVMAFAKASREIKQVQQKGQTFVLQELNNLPFSQRDIQQWNKEFSKSIGKFQPLLMELFDNPPVIELSDYNDNISITRIREYYTTKMALKNSYMETVEKNTETFAAALKSRLCFGDMTSEKNSELMEELNGLRAEYAKMDNNYKQLKRQNNSLKTALSRYEAFEENDKRRGEEEEQRAREKDKALHAQRRTIQKLEAVLDTPVFSNNVAKLRQQFDTPKEPPINRLRDTTTTDENSRDSTTKNNSRYDRRSKSVCRPLIPKNY
uniref:Kinesin-like protein n=1 Tax=Panagrolaimus davidi TaxID=227884 RepID=A0A914PA13_9BILA